jgi:hypothetical protein
MITTVIEPLSLLAKPKSSLQHCRAAMLKIVSALPAIFSGAICAQGAFRISAQPYQLASAHHWASVDKTRRAKDYEPIEHATEIRLRAGRRLGK